MALEKKSQDHQRLTARIVNLEAGFEEGSEEHWSQMWISTTKSKDLTKLKPSMKKTQDLYILFD